MALLKKKLREDEMKRCDIINRHSHFMFIHYDIILTLHNTATMYSDYFRDINNYGVECITLST